MSLIDEMLNQPDQVIGTGYSHERKELLVEFRDGRKLLVSDIPSELFDQMNKQADQGTFFTLNILYQYKDKIKEL